MPFKEIECQTLLRTFTHSDVYFHGMYGVDVYQNCTFGCRYCDSSYDSMIYVCRNAVEVLEQEIKRIPVGRVIIGSVHDPYQPVEERYGLVRQVIDLLLSYGFSVHVLTKSPLVFRDIDILKKSHDALVTVSIVSLDSHINEVFEPKVPRVCDRLKTVERLVDNGIQSGVAVFPILPFLVEDELSTIVQEVKMRRAEYIVFKHLELKGQQKEDYFSLIEKNFPLFLDKYQALYKDQFSPTNKYIDDLKLKMSRLCMSFGISCGIPI